MARPRASTTSTRRRFKVVHVGRFDSELKDVVIDNGNTVQDVLTKAGITLSTGEECNKMNGTAWKLDAKVKNDDYIVITGSYRSGNY